MKLCLFLLVVVLVTNVFAIKHVFIIAEWHPMAVVSDSYSIMLFEDEHIAHARYLIEYRRQYPYMEEVVAPLIIGEITYQIGGFNFDFLAPVVTRWNWHVGKFRGFSDYSPGIWDVSPTWIEAYGKDAGQEIIGAWGYTIVAEYPFSFQTGQDDDWKTGWYGEYWDGYFPWVYHREHGWVYVFGLDPSSIWFWEPDLGFTWTAEGFYPWFWSALRGDWLYYAPGSIDPRWYYSANSKSWIAETKLDP